MLSKNLEHSKQGLAFVISAPAGTGKTTLAKMLAEEFPHVITSVSFTTRKPRHGEIPGKDYHFLSADEFEKKIESEDFLEHVQLYGNCYGTSRQWVQEQLRNGKHVIMTIDTQGGLLLKNQFPAIFIFILPPSLNELRKRLEQRKTETPEGIEKRLEVAKKEVEAAHLYDYNIVNDNLEVAYQTLRSILIAEEHRVRVCEHI
jgi:guanylate kinase